MMSFGAIESLRDNIEIIEHHGHPVVIEKAPIYIALFPGDGRPIEQNLILHPRYADEGITHSLAQVRGYRRGRSIDVLLETPREIDGKNCWILNFKGVGALAHEEMVIATVPGVWFRSGTWWAYRPKEPSSERIFGAVRKVSAEEEITSDVFKRFGIPAVHYVGVNEVPDKILLRIYDSFLRRSTAANYGGDRQDPFYGISPCFIESQYKDKPQISQLVRAMTTNIRFHDLSEMKYRNKMNLEDSRERDTYSHALELCERYIDARMLAEINAILINAQRRLNEDGKMLRMFGSLDMNRHIDGELMDAENYEVIDICAHDHEREGDPLIRDLSGVKRYLRGDQLEIFRRTVEELTSEASGDHRSGEKEGILSRIKSYFHF